MKSTSEKSIESMGLNIADVEEHQLNARRIQTYSIGALRAAIVVDRIHIQHPQFLKVISAMDRLFEIGPQVDMPNGMILSGPPGVGKTAMFNYYSKTIPPLGLFSPGLGAIGLRCPQRPRVGHFVAALLQKFRYPFAIKSYRQMYVRRGLVFDAIKDKGTRLLFIDEANALLSPKNLKHQVDGETEASEFLRELVDECKVSLVLAGTHDLDAVSKMDSALASRISVLETFSNFSADQTWAGILKAFAAQSTIFDMTQIYKVEMSKLIHLATDGNLRSLKRLLTEAVLIAHDSQNSVIDQAILSKAHAVVFGSGSWRGNVFA